MLRLLVLSACALLCSCHAPAPAAKGDAARGQAAFRAQCAICHNADSPRKKVGPGLKGLFERENTTEAGIRAKIETGGNGMPPFRDALEPGEEDGLIAYLRTL